MQVLQAILLCCPQMCLHLEAWNLGKSDAVDHPISVNWTNLHVESFSYFSKGLWLCLPLQYRFSSHDSTPCVPSGFPKKAEINSGLLAPNAAAVGHINFLPCFHGRCAGNPTCRHTLAHHSIDLPESVISDDQNSCQLRLQAFPTSDFWPLEPAMIQGNHLFSTWNSSGIPLSKVIQKAGTLENGHDVQTSQGTHFHKSGASLDDSRCFLPKTGGAENVKQLTIYVIKGVCVCVYKHIVILSYPNKTSSPFISRLYHSEWWEKNRNKKHTTPSTVLLGDFSSTASRDPDPSIGSDSSLRAFRRRSAFRVAKVNLERWIFHIENPLQCRFCS